MLMNGKLYPTKCDDATKLNLALMLQQILLDENLTFLLERVDNEGNKF